MKPTASAYNTAPFSYNVSLTIADTAAMSEDIRAKLKRKFDEIEELLEQNKRQVKAKTDQQRHSDEKELGFTHRKNGSRVMFVFGNDKKARVKQWASIADDDENKDEGFDADREALPVIDTTDFEMFS